MITTSDSPNTIETDEHYIIVPALADFTQQELIARYSSHHQGKLVAPGFSYSSGANTQWLSVEELRSLIKIHS